MILLVFSFVFPIFGTVETTATYTHEQEAKLLEQLREKDIQIAFLKQELAQLKRMMFGVKSERYAPVIDGQFSLFDNATMGTKEAAEPETMTIVRKKTNDSKNKPVRTELPSHLPRVEIIIEPKENTEGAIKIGEEITEILEYRPGKIFVERYVRPKYVLPQEKGIVIGTLPTFPIHRGNVGAGLISQLLIAKFVDHMPFYRQVQAFKRDGVVLAESTINGWFNASCDLLSHLYDRLKTQALQSGYLMVDETPIPVQNVDKKGATHTGYHWVYNAPHLKLLFFDYRHTRSRSGPEEILKDYQGAIQTDGYVAYDIYEQRENITLLSCMAHARRKFEAALNNDADKAQHALLLIQKLYRTEREAREGKLSFEQRKTLRQEQAKPVLDEFYLWLNEQFRQVLPKSAMGIAVNYTLGLWKRLVRYIDNGEWEIDNNLVENSIRPLTLGRKNYMFAGSEKGAKNAAIVYSILGSCKKNNINPYEYLVDVLSKIPDCKKSELDSLLPNVWKSEKK